MHTTRNVPDRVADDPGHFSPRTHDDVTILVLIIGHTRQDDPFTFRFAEKAGPPVRPGPVSIEKDNRDHPSG